MKDKTNLELLDVVDDALVGGAYGDPAREAVAELRARLAEPTYWPEQTFATAKEIFGPAVYGPETRTYKALDRRIRHALRVWDEKYGPLNPEQESYADAAIAGALRAARAEAGGDKRKLWPYTQTAIGKLILHERVHEGFKRRAGLVDVSATLAELA